MERILVLVGDAAEDLEVMFGRYRFEGPDVVDGKHGLLHGLARPRAVVARVRPRVRAGRGVRLT